MAQNRPVLLAALVVCAPLWWANPASAKDKDPGVVACEGKKAGDPCTFMKLSKPADGELQQVEESGVCKAGECCELDYSKGSPPDTVCGPCLACEATGSPTPPIPTADDAAPASEPPRSGDDPPAPAGNDKRGCSVGAVAPQAPGLGLLLLLGLLCRLRRGG